MDKHVRLFGRETGNRSESVIQALDEVDNYIRSIPPGEWGNETVYLRDVDKAAIEKKADEEGAQKQQMAALNEALNDWAGEHQQKLARLPAWRRIKDLRSKLLAHVKENKAALTPVELTELRTFVASFEATENLSK